MGIKNLSKLLKRHAPDAIREIGLSDLSGKSAAIDVSIFMYKFMYSGRGDPIPSFMRLLDSCASFQITPIFVFDGACSPAKANEMEKRREERERNKKRLEEIEQRLRNFNGSIIEKREMQMQQVRMKKRVTTVPTRKNYMNLRGCLARHNVSMVQACGDAEKECVRLAAAGQVHVVISEDFDVLPYMAGIANGRGKFITGFATSRMVEYDMERVLQCMGLVPLEFIDTCILCGCDFSCKVAGIAIFRAFALISQHRNIEVVLRNLDQRKYVIPDCFQFEAARQEFCGTS